MSGSKEFRGEIVVASRIVDYLSSGLYEKPSSCLKELINNSYDADATRVDVFVKPDANRIIIEDNGCGMDRVDFEKHFKKISESHKRDDTDCTTSGRPKIGKIGIGFIAANEICDVMEIISTKKGSPELLEVTINFHLMRQEPILRKRKGTDVAKGDYEGRVSVTDLDSHYTQVFLKGVRGESSSILAGAGSTNYTSGKISLYGFSANSLLKKLKDPTIRTWTQFDAYSKNILEIALNVPVRYHGEWIPNNLRPQIKEFEKHVNDLNFTLNIDGSEVRKPIVFDPDGQALVSRFNYKGNHVSAKGYFFAQASTVRPQELQGLLIRIRNASIGEYDPTFLGFSSSIGTLFQKWISGEIMADDRLEEAMNIDRRTLRIAHPAYVELQQAVHAHMSKLIKRVRDEIYGSNTLIRKADKAHKVEKKIFEVAEQEIVRIAPKAAKSMQRLWSDANKNIKGQNKLLKKYTVDELYKIVVEVAQEILSPAQLETFIEKLTERISR